VSSIPLPACNVLEESQFPGWPLPSVLASRFVLTSHPTLHFYYRLIIVDSDFRGEKKRKWRYNKIENFRWLCYQLFCLALGSSSQNSKEWKSQTTGKQSGKVYWESTEQSSHSWERSQERVATGWSLSSGLYCCKEEISDKHPYPDWLATIMISFLGHPGICMFVYVCLALSGLWSPVR
jgi:hypothetical protein